MSCPTPYFREINGYRVPCPCGKCLQCRIDTRNMWTWRILGELQDCDGVFVTLTIDDENLVGDSVYKRSVVDYHKRLRKNLDGRKIKYFTVSEYGELFGRPHYHEILMNVSAGKPCSSDLGDIPAIRRSWKYGFIKVEPASASSIRYVLKYLDKEFDELSSYKALGVNPPFRLMSKGIGSKFIESLPNYLNDKNQFFFNGAWRPLPRYYKEKLGLLDSAKEDFDDIDINAYVNRDSKRRSRIMEYFSQTYSDVAGYENALVSAVAKAGKVVLDNLKKKSDIGKDSNKI